VKQIIEGNSANRKSVQIIRNDMVHDHTEKRYPHLYDEVMKHDRISGSSWYDLTPEAYEEYRRFCRSVWYKG
jgi:hypothetical protein